MTLNPKTQENIRFFPYILATGASITDSNITLPSFAPGWIQFIHFKNFTTATVLVSVGDGGPHLYMPPHTWDLYDLATNRSISFASLGNPVIKIKRIGAAGTGSFIVQAGGFLS